MKEKSQINIITVVLLQRSLKAKIKSEELCCCFEAETTKTVSAIAKRESGLCCQERCPELLSDSRPCNLTGKLTKNGA